MFYAKTFAKMCYSRRLPESGATWTTVMLYRRERGAQEFSVALKFRTAGLRRHKTLVRCC